MPNRVSPNIAPSIFYKTDLCPIRSVISGVSGKWPLLILAHLSFGQHRFSELLNGIPDISQRMLTQTLRSLERDGLVERHVTASIPPRVDYQLTERGQTLLPIVQSLMQWGLENRKDIEADQEATDLAKAREAAQKDAA
ncbi:winged helix-turn-helix transcriptional regulator [Litorimonas sp. RW-G-Af-16]|uniref:winged helix-turn-helix transcriptional regulator n=1 Tax=Litorimonas sp. RW-G-Af-16 TaxID=3241168 RepID=UPI00390CB512